MRKNFKRALAVLCAAALTTLSVAVAGNLSSLKNAAEVSPSGEINFGGDSAYLKLDNALKSAPASVEAEVKMPSTIKDEWTLRNGEDTSNFAGGMTSDNGLVTVGTTDENDAPGAGMGYIEFTSNDKTLTAFTNNLGIDVSRYEASDLALAFWAYSDTAGKLFENGQLRLSSKASGEDNKPYARYFAYDIKVNAGWNYIELPLSSFESVNDYNFITDGINTLRINGCKNVTDVRMQRLGDFKLVVKKDASEWTLREGGKSSTKTYEGGLKADDIDEYVSLATDEPGAGLKFEEFTSNSNTFSISGDSVDIDLSAYALNELAVDFWCYSTNEGSLFDGGYLVINNRTNKVADDTTGPFARYAGKNIAVNSGWNHIKITLDKFESVNKKDTDEAYDWSQNIKIFRFNGLKNTAKENEIRIGEVKLVANTDNKVYTSSVDKTVYDNGYSVFSNMNSNDGDTPYALFVTREGKPAFIYNDKMFVLNHNVCTGEFVKIRAAVNSDGTVAFTAGDYTAASTDTVDTASAFTFTSGHSIGADAVGGTLMNGSIKNLVVSDDTGVVGNWTLAANKAYPLNAVKNSVGSNNAHFAGIANSNAAVVVRYENATAGTAPADADDMDGYVFAGWFTDADCTKALEGTGSAYAKYVDKAVLTVKAQIKTDAATAESTSMRFVTTVDSLNYKSVGFVINNVDKTLKTVYSKLYVVGGTSVSETAPKDLSNTSASAYFATFTVNNIPKDKYSAEFNVTPYWITLDGTRVSADTVVKAVSQGI